MVNTLKDIGKIRTEIFAPKIVNTPDHNHLPDTGISLTSYHFSKITAKNYNYFLKVQDERRSAVEDLKKLGI